MSFYGRYKGFGDDSDFTLPSFDTTATPTVTDGSTTPNFVMMNPVPGPTDDSGPGNALGTQAQFTAGQGFVPSPSSTTGSPPMVAVPANNSSSSGSSTAGGSFLSGTQGLLNIFGQVLGNHPAATTPVATATPSWLLPVALIGGIGVVGLILVSTHKKSAMGRYKRSRR